MTCVVIATWVDYADIRSGHRGQLGQTLPDTPWLSPTVTGTTYGWFMPPLPRLAGREIVRALGKLGWVVVIQRGSHAQLKHPSRGGRVTVPLHAGETIGPGLLRSILNQAGVSIEEFRTVM